MRKKLLQVLSALGLTDKAKNADLSAADWATVSQSYYEKFGTQLSDDISQTNKSHSISDEELTSYTNSIVDILNSSDITASQASDVNPGDLQSVAAALNTVVKTLNTMASKPIPDLTPTVYPNISAKEMNHTDTHLFGIESPLYSTNKRWNQIMVATEIKPLSIAQGEEVNNSFFKEFSSFCSSFAQRFAYLTLNPAAAVSSISINASESDSYINQFTTLRQDALYARIAKYKDVYTIFPRVFNVQDKAVMTNADFGSYSQGYQKGRVFKGTVELTPEWAWVDDAMLKTNFDSYKELERKYLGYLNREGSDPIKWTLIEWSVLNIVKVLMLEQAKRKIMGFYVKPELNKPSHYLQAGNGLIATLLRFKNENKVLPFAGDYLVNGEANGSAMLSLLDTMYKKVSSCVDDISEYEIIMNSNHKKAYLDSIRSLYGNNTDFAQNDTKYFDTDVAIRWVPYMNKLPLIIIQKPGNLQAIENIPGEMTALQFKTDMEEVLYWSTWKEGFSAYYAGKKHSSLSNLIAADMEDQDIFFNLPIVELSADATTVTASSSALVYKTGENANQVAITDILNAKQGYVYFIENSGKAKPQTIAKSGKFTDITAAYTPSVKGDYIALTLNADGDKFKELERCVAGTRIVNKTVQPNVVI